MCYPLPPRQEIYVPGLNDGFQMSGQDLILGSRTFWLILDWNDWNIPELLFVGRDRIYNAVLVEKWLQVKMTLAFRAGNSLHLTSNFLMQVLTPIKAWRTCRFHRKWGYLVLNSKWTWDRGVNVSYVIQGSLTSFCEVQLGGVLSSVIWNNCFVQALICFGYLPNTCVLV